MRDKQGHKLILHSCEVCGKKRYIRIHNGKPLNKMCKPCSKGRPKELHRINDTGHHDDQHDKKDEQKNYTIQGPHLIIKD